MRLRALASVLVALLSPAAGAVGEPQSQPHDYVFAAPRVSADPAGFLVRLRDSVGKAIRSTGLAKPGYPRPCRIVETPNAGDRALITAACVETTTVSETAAGLQLGTEDYYILFSILDEPRAAHYQAVVFLVDSLKDRRLSTDERHFLPRIAIHAPVAPSSATATRGRDRVARLDRAIAQGIRATGARVLKAQ